MKPSPYQIAAFTEAARERSFSRAAEAMGVTQSSVTQHVAKLERAIGAKLFVRRSDGLELTRAGRDLFVVSDRLRTVERAVHEKIARFGDMTTGHLNVIANAPRPAMPAIARFAELHPGVEIEFGLHDWTTAMGMLREGEADAGLITEPGVAAGLHMRCVGTTRYMLHVRRDDPLARRLSVSLRDVAAEHVLVLPEDGSFTQRVFRAALSRHEIEAPRVMKIRTFAALKEAVLHGLGAGILLEDSLFPSRQLAAVEIDEMPEVYANHLVVPSPKRDLAVVRRFGDIVADLSVAPR